MKEYALRDFARYYNHSFVIDPQDGEIGQLTYTQAFRDDNNGVQNETMRISKNSAKDVSDMGGKEVRALPPIDHNTLEWKHVKRPALGYRHSDGGKKLYFASVNRGDQIPKGLNERCILLENPPQTVAVAAAIGLPKTHQMQHYELTLEEAKELHHPHYMRLSDALARLSSDRELCVGFALSCDTAITLGKSEDSAFVLLFRGTPAAYSKDGKTWEYTNPEYKGVLNRHAK